MHEVKKVLFIVNKFAGGGFRDEHQAMIENVCTRFGAQGIIEFTKAAGHATTIAREASRLDYYAVVAVGGDGTLNEVAQGLLATAMPLGIIPRGSGNGLARHLKIPLGVSAAAENVFTGAISPIDTFTLNKKLSLNVSGIGFDGRIANLFGGKTKRGLTGYAKLTLQEYFAFQEFDTEIITENATLVRKAFIVAIANSSQYGNNACIAPTASVSDGVLHLNVLKKVAPYRLDFIYSFFTRKIDQTDAAEIIPVKNFTITTPLPVPYHVDGEPSGTDTNFEVILNPLSLRVIFPA